MNTLKHKNRIIISFTLAILFLSIVVINAQNMELVWAEEFDGTVLDNSKWEYGIGTSNDNVHYYTARDNNVSVSNGTLKIIALEESYQGFNYTSGLIKTLFISSWKYGRIESRIKLPQSNGFVPAFWMLPEDESYGWWPNSGEIDIMEHPTNEINKIYGTVHTEAYNSFTGSGPVGSTITISDAETEFHLYAIEWNENQIDFFVDDQKYFTFNNNNSGSAAWPFNKQFYLILNLAVGGGWVGNPNSNTVFPAVMEVDYVRVYQNIQDVSISGADYLPFYTKGSVYSLPNIDGVTYSWNVQAGAQIVSGQNTNSIVVDWNIFSGNVEAEITNAGSIYNYEYPVIVSNNFLKNYGFEKGVKHWNQTRPYPGDIDFTLVSEDPHTGNNCLYVDVKSSSINAWDVQLSQRNLLLETGKQYSASFWAKAKISGTKIAGAVINSTTFAPFAIQEFTLTDNWAKYNLNFTPSITAIGQFNIDMGGHLGSYYFDDFALSLPELNDSNQITNADFSNGNTDWIFNTYAPAQATGEVKNGEFAVSISNGGIYLWDIHLGQLNVTCEKGKEYVISFDAYADEARQISAIVGKNSDPWTVYSDSQIITLSTEKKTYSYNFVMNDPTDTQARLGFDLGTSSVDLYFDNIMLIKGKTPTNIENGSHALEKSLQLFQNYPNPFNPATKVKYSIPKHSFVILRVFDVLGKEVANLVNEEKLGGEYEVEFNGQYLASGMYYYRLQVGDFINTKKMLLLK